MLSDTISDKYIQEIKSEQQPVSALHLIKSLGRGGAETLLPEMLSEFNQSAYNFHYIYFLPWKDQMVQEIEKAGGKVICFSSKNNLGIFLKIFKLVSYIKKNNIRFIHCHMPWTGVVGRLAGKLSKVPVIYTEHNKWERYHWFTYYTNKWSFAGQKKVIAVSEDVAASIQKHYKKNLPPVEVIQNGINTNKFFPDFSGVNIRKKIGISDDKIVIGITCVFRKQKRLLIWLAIAKQLCSRFNNLFFIVVGDGVLHDEVFAKCEELQMNENIHFAGLQSEVRPYLKAMNIFMMTSEFEGLPIALMEAMSMQCMPACTSAGGISEVINNNLNGILVPVEEPYNLVNRLSEYLKNPSKISDAGKAARQTVIQNFSMKKMVAELDSLYKTL